MRRRALPTVRTMAPNLAPLVDVVMVILIFFMLGTSFAVSEGALPTHLPADVGPGGGATVSIVPVVQIALLPGSGAEDCQIFVMERALPASTFEALLGYLRGKLEEGADPGGRVVIAAESSVRYQHVISALDACLRAGFRNVQFSVDPARAIGEPGAGGT